MYFLKGSRYYILEIYANLFNQYNVEITFGSILFKSPTGNKIKIFDRYDDAKKYFEKILKKRLLRGYIIK